MEEKTKMFWIDFRSIRESITNTVSPDVINLLKQETRMIAALIKKLEP
jgi:hypothetical protein